MRLHQDSQMLHAQTAMLTQPSAPRAAVMAGAGGIGLGLVRYSDFAPAVGPP